MAYESIDIGQSVRVLHNLLEEAARALHPGQIFNDAELVEYVKANLLEKLLKELSIDMLADYYDITDWARRHGFRPDDTI